MATYDACVYSQWSSYTKYVLKKCVWAQVFSMIRSVWHVAYIRGLLYFKLFLVSPLSVLIADTVYKQIYRGYHKMLFSKFVEGVSV